LTLVRIPKDLLIEKLVSEIKKTYKTDKNSNDILEKIYAIDNFISDIESEIADYQKKYNIILIGNFEKRDECLEKIKDNIKKLIYLKNCANPLKDNFAKYKF
jgi:stalled ribosome rescue protein Dom34